MISSANRARRVFCGQGEEADGRKARHSPVRRPAPDGGRANRWFATAAKALRKPPRPGCQRQRLRHGYRASNPSHFDHGLLAPATPREIALRFAINTRWQRPGDAGEGTVIRGEP